MYATKKVRNMRAHFRHRAGGHGQTLQAKLEVRVRAVTGLLAAVLSEAASLHLKPFSEK